MFHRVWREATTRNSRCRLDPANLPRDVLGIIGEYVMSRIRENMIATAIECLSDHEPICMLRGEPVTISYEPDDMITVWHGKREIYTEITWHPCIDIATGSFATMVR